MFACKNIFVKKSSIEESLPHHSNLFHVYFVAPLPPGHPIERRELDEARRPLG